MWIHFRFSFSLLALLASIVPVGQNWAQTSFNSKEITGGVWETLAETKYRNGEPKFPKSVRELSGTEVQVKGYIYPLTQSVYHAHFILTSLPTSACYFCGVGGPETVMEVLALKQIRYSKEPVTLQGILVLNEDDEEHLSVMLVDAKRVDD